MDSEIYIWVGLLGITLGWFVAYIRRNQKWVKELARRLNLQNNTVDDSFGIAMKIELNGDYNGHALKIWQRVESSGRYRTHFTILEMDLTSTKKIDLELKPLTYGNASAFITNDQKFDDTFQVTGYFEESIENLLDTRIRNQIIALKQPGRKLLTLNDKTLYFKMNIRSDQIILERKDLALEPDYYEKIVLLMSDIAGKLHRFQI